MLPPKLPSTPRKVRSKRSPAFQAIQRNLRKTPVAFASYQNNEEMKIIEVNRMMLSKDVFKTIF